MKETNSMEKRMQKKKADSAFRGMGQARIY